jgi:hypothetical protein
MSFILTNNAINNQPIFDYKHVGLEFSKYYYNMFSSQGLQNLSNLYDLNALITFLEEECIGFVALNQKMSNLGINKMLFNNLIGTTQPHQDDSVLLNVTGECAVSTNNSGVPIWGKFNDVFILTLINGNWIIKQHIFKIIN